MVRSDYNGLRRYAHLGTGNYHAGTARLYCDLGMLTCDPDIGHDLTELFNYLTTGCKPSRKYRKVLAAPKTMKKALLTRIEREISLHSKRSPGLIRFKTNALEDADITDALYRASMAGVQVELVIRDDYDKFEGRVTARVTRSQTVLEDITDKERRAVWAKMTKAMIADLERELRKQIQTHLTRYVR